jgi:cell division protein FtsI/penicillin-binding protein 2
MSQSASQQSTSREKWFGLTLIGLFLVIFARLFYWQIIRGSELQQAVIRQTQRTLSKVGERGQILTSDGFVLVGNQPYYKLAAQKAQLTTPKNVLVDTLTPLLLKETPEFLLATSSAAQTEAGLALSNQLSTQLDKTNPWITLRAKISPETKTAIEALHLPGLQFEAFSGRYYPEASMAAQVVGFVGKTEDGDDQGYFGIEGGLNQELKGKAETRTVLTDALGKILPGEKFNFDKPIDGRDVVLTIRRDLQQLAEEFLANGIEKYGAKAGEIIIMEPSTGKIRALATWPTYLPQYYYWYDPSLYKNPAVVDIYEPGSTFKTLTLSAGIDTGVVAPDTICPSCAGPRNIGGYTIKTWDNTYHPNITMTEALEKSDNVAMMYVSDMLGKDQQIEYLKRFAIGEPLHIDLQEDTKTPFPARFGPVELATSSFGQGITTTSLQLMRAVSAIANQGEMMRPMIVEKVIDHQRNQVLPIEPTLERQVITPQTAEKMTTMMISSAVHGEAQWAVLKKYTIAGKTGTSQIPGPGGYQADKTIASFIGFAPPNNPQMVMLVKLIEPSSSPWAAETAAPLWFHLAEKVFVILGVEPDK